MVKEQGEYTNTQPLRSAGDASTACLLFKFDLFHQKNKMGRRKLEGKPEKDPNKPKRGMSAYLYFAADQRTECKAKGIDTSQVAQFTKDMAAKWKVLTPKERKPYDAKAEKDKQRYLAEMAAYVPPKGMAGGKRPVDPNKPKRAQTAYFLFLAEFRAKHKDEFTGEGSNKELIKAASVAWNGLSSAEKAPFEQKYKEEKKLADAAMAKYKANGGGAAAAPARKAKVEHTNGHSAEEEEDDDDEDEEDDEEEDEESD